MNPNPKEPTWKRLQRGQALMEYWPTIPAAVAIMIGAAVLVSFVNSAFLRTANGLDRYCKSPEPVETKAEMFNHKVEGSAAVYDPETNRTTVAFTVTSGSQPSISHWVLGLPKEVAAHIIQSSEPYEWTDNDPTTGAAGIKFDRGYEADGGGNNGGGNNGGNNGGGKGKKASNAGLVLAGYSRPVAFAPAAAGEATDTRMISITLDGNYLFGAVTVVTKAGSDQVGTGTISAPVERVDDNSDDGSSNNSGGGNVDRSKGC